VMMVGKHSCLAKLEQQCPRQAQKLRDFA
jgi:hypothetical protein